jgi:hypothetical protein
MGAHRTSIFLIIFVVILASAIAYFASASVIKIAENEKEDPAFSSSDGKRDNVVINKGNVHDPAIAAGFVPHKALYEIKLSGKKSGSQILNIHGHMLYDWNSSCEAWNSTHKFTLTYEYADSLPLKVSSDYSLYEMFDGTSLEYYSQRKSEGEVTEELRGSAHMNPNGGKAENRMPEGLSFDLPSGTLFPMHHSLEVFKQMRAGKKFFNAVIFDGSDQEGPIAVNAFMGAQQMPPQNLKNIDSIDQSLISAPAHFVRLAFFPLKSEASQADYEMSMLLHDNGVISDMEIDYEDFSVTQRLTALEKIDGNCGQDQAKK